MLSYQVERNETWDLATLLLAPVVGIFTLKLFNLKIIEAPRIELKWFKAAIFLGAIYAFLKLFIKLFIFEHNIETYSLELSKLLENIFMIIIFMPILEEFFFRGILFDDLKKVFGIVFSIMFTSIAFIFLHLQNFSDGEILGSIFAMIPVIFLYNYLKIKTNNFLTSYSAHLTHNIIVFSFVTISYRVIN